MKKRLLATTVLSLSMFVLALAQAGQTKAPAAGAAQAVVVTRGGSQPSEEGPAENFTGSVRIGPLFPAREPSRAAGASVTFEPGARTAWHTHPAGQTLIVTAGSGLVQQWGGRIQEIRPGDVVWIPPSQKHWHGATPTTPMTHIAIQEQVNGKVVEWMEKVSDDQYLAKPSQP
jgi:quercetin dioxygenase-like cupin family protein